MSDDPARLKAFMAEVENALREIASDQFGFVVVAQGRGGTTAVATNLGTVDAIVIQAGAIARLARDFDPPTEGNA